MDPLGRAMIDIPDRPQRAGRSTHPGTACGQAKISGGNQAYHSHRPARYFIAHLLHLTLAATPSFVQSRDKAQQTGTLTVAWFSICFSREPLPAGSPRTRVCEAFFPFYAKLRTVRFHGSGIATSKKGVPCTRGREESSTAESAGGVLGVAGSAGRQAGRRLGQRVPADNLGPEEIADHGSPSEDLASWKEGVG